MSSAAQHLRFVSVAVAWVPIACGGASDAPPAATVRDSSGVRIVEDVPVGDPHATWTVSDEPLYRVGWSDDDPTFENLTAGALLPDGRAVVGDQGSSLLYWISPTGEVLAEAGGRGEGPGEIGGIAAVLHLAGDSVLVQDDGNARLDVFVDGVHRADDPFLGYYASAIYAVAGRLDDGRFLLTPRDLIARALQGTSGWAEYPILALSPDLTAVDTLVQVGIVHLGGASDRNPLRPSGSPTAAGTRLAYAESSRPEVSWYGGDGGLEQIVRPGLSAVEAGDALWAEYEASFRERWADRDPEDAEQRLAEARRDFGGVVPFFGWARGDRDGNVWLSEYSITGLEADGFTVVAADGASAHTVVFPTELRILDITHDRVLGVEEDDLDVQAVVLYPLQRGG